VAGEMTMTAADGADGGDANTTPRFIVDGSQGFSTE
jgi:hypothetical protein